MKFAEFLEQNRKQPWRRAVVRSMEAADVAEVGAILADREDVALDRATELVSRWVEPTTERLVLVAEHQGRVQAYGKAEWLVPQDRGGDAPTGWYLTGLVVAPSARRHGLGAALTERRIRVLGATADEVWYFANLRNQATIALHARQGFTLHTRDFRVPGVIFDGGQGALFRLPITQR